MRSQSVAGIAKGVPHVLGIPQFLRVRPRDAAQAPLINDVQFFVRAGEAKGSFVVTALVGWRRKIAQLISSIKEFVRLHGLTLRHRKAESRRGCLKCRSISYDKIKPGMFGFTESFLFLGRKRFH